MTVGERIRQRREALSIQQTELAAMVGTTKQQIYKYENGIITNIPSDKIELIAEALKTTPADLMGWESPQLDSVYFRFAKQAQDEGILPSDIQLAIDTIKKLRGE